jgi:hypothetical protein
MATAACSIGIGAELNGAEANPRHTGRLLKYSLLQKIGPRTNGKLARICRGRP